MRRYKYFSLLRSISSLLSSYLIGLQTADRPGYSAHELCSPTIPPALHTAERIVVQTGNLKGIIFDCHPHSFHQCRRAPMAWRRIIMCLCFFFSCVSEGVARELSASTRSLLLARASVLTERLATRYCPHLSAAGMSGSACDVLDIQVAAFSSAPLCFPSFTHHLPPLLTPLHPVFSSPACSVCTSALTATLPYVRIRQPHCQQAITRTRRTSNGPIDGRIGRSGHQRAGIRISHFSLPFLFFFFQERQARWLRTIEGLDCERSRVISPSWPPALHNAERNVVAVWRRHGHNF